MRERILAYLNELYPDADCELTFSDDYELLVKIILSAQTTDKMVNKISLKLFLKYPKITDLSTASLTDVEEIIKPLGLSKVKARNIVNTAKFVCDNYDGVIPSEFEKLIKLDGVGVKTANVFMAVMYGIPRFAVDTHVKRVANRLSISKSSNVTVIEKDLMKFFDKNTWIKTHHQMIFFGRYFCLAKPKNCEICKLKDICTLNFY